MDMKLRRLHREHAKLAKWLKTYKMTKPTSKIHEESLDRAILRVSKQMDSIMQQIKSFPNS